MLTALLSLVVGAALGAVVVFVLWIRDRQSLVETVARSEAERDAAVRSDALQREQLASSQLQLREAFSALSRSALKENRDDFLGNAQTVLEPMKDALEKVERHLNDVDKAREGSFRAVASELNLLRGAQEQLRASADGLSRSLGSPNVRGAWGEIQLRRIVELAGMLPQCDFEEKISTASDTGSRQTPDLVVRLPGDATIVVDAKVPIQAYRTAVNAKDEATRLESFDAHARQFRDHLRSLGAKEYWKQFQPAPEFVVMFLPLEPLLGAAFERDDSLFEQAASLRVIVATPMTLLALLKTVAYGWRQQEIATNAEEIQMLGRQLYERLASMVEHLDSVGRNLKQAAQSYDGLVGSLETKVLPGARRFKDLGVTSTKELESVEPLRLEVRTVVKPELTGRPDSESAESDTNLRLLRQRGGA
jgi:DNA recombination protein RmuC